MNEFLKKFKNFEIARNTRPVEQVPDKTVTVHKWYNHKIWTTSRNRYKLHGGIEDVAAPIWGKTKTILPTFCPVMDMYTIKGITLHFTKCYTIEYTIRVFVSRKSPVQMCRKNFLIWNLHYYIIRWLINLFQYFNFNFYWIKT